MTGSIALDVVIGLIFIYLLYSLLATIVQEWIASLFAFRAKFLEKAIIRMLEDGKADVATNFFSSFWGIFKMFCSSGLLTKNPVANAFYNHPLVKYLAEDDYHKRPSYLTAQNFSKTLIDLLRGNQVKPEDDVKQLIEDALHAKGSVQWSSNPAASGPPINSQTLDYLKSLWADSQGDVAKFSTALEGWFDTTMERVTGWYKKHTQALLLIIGFVIAWGFNVDTIQIANNLANNPTLRAEMVKQAGAYLKANPTSPDAGKLDSLATEKLQSDIKNIPSTITCGEENKNSPYKLMGWILTAFAISLGAPFWFDLLNKLMKVRATIATSTSSSPTAQAPNAGGSASTSTQTVG